MVATVSCSALAATCSHAPNLPQRHASRGAAGRSLRLFPARTCGSCCMCPACASGLFSSRRSVAVHVSASKSAGHRATSAQQSPAERDHKAVLASTAAMMASWFPLVGAANAAGSAIAEDGLQPNTIIFFALGAVIAVVAAAAPKSDSKDTTAAPKKATEPAKAKSAPAAAKKAPEPEKKAPEPEKKAPEPEKVAGKSEPVEVEDLDAVKARLEKQLQIPEPEAKVEKEQPQVVEEPKKTAAKKADKVKEEPAVAKDDAKDDILPREALSKGFTSDLKPSGEVKTTKEAAPKAIPLSNEVQYMVARTNIVQQHFPSALAMDDFAFRMEMLLGAHGFYGDNTIAVANMCRDEITCGLKYKIEQAFPLVFNINGLGGGITAGVIGFGAGLSHSPVSVAGKKRYVFFSFPHIAINSKGVVGEVGRPGQSTPNSACGALIAALGQFKEEGVESNIKDETFFDEDNPEYSILKARIARRMQQEQQDPADIDLVEMTKIAERQITADLEYLISESVNPSDADYAIVTGVQIHNWGESFDNEEPNLEFVAPTRMSVIVDGERSEFDLGLLPPPTPRQLRKMAKKPLLETTRSVAVYTGTSTVTDVDGSPMFSNTDERARRKERSEQFQSFSE